MTDSEKTTATIEGPAWNAGASVLDVGCGSGEFCELAAARGGRVAICNWGRIEDPEVHLTPLGLLRAGVRRWRTSSVRAWRGRWR